LGQQGDLIVSEAHGRFYEQTYRGSTFRFGTNVVITGASTMAIATGLSTTLSTSASGVPMLGIWNPPTSSVNVVLLQAQVNPMFNTATTPTPFGSLMWGSSLGNGGIQLGQLPFNSKTLMQSGSQVKAFNGWQTLAGLTNPVTALEPADLNGGGMVAYGTASQTVGSTTISVQNFDGQMIVPPGGVLALFSTTSTTSFSYTGRLLWEEVPL
jgi:hypothetical protein